MTRFRRQLHNATRSPSASSRPPSGARDSNIASRCLCQPCSDSKCATTGRRLRMPCLVALRLTLSLPWSVFGPVLLFLSRATTFLPSAIRIPSSPQFDRRHHFLWVVLDCTLALILYALVVAAGYHQVELASAFSPGLISREKASSTGQPYSWPARTRRRSSSHSASACSSV